MKKEELKSLVGKNVKITLFNDKVLTGRLRFIPEFSEKYNWLKPNYFNLEDYIFKVSHVKKVEVLEGSGR